MQGESAVAYSYLKQHGSVKATAIYPVDEMRHGEFIRRHITHSGNRCYNSSMSQVNITLKLKFFELNQVKAKMFGEMSSENTRAS